MLADIGRVRDPKPSPTDLIAAIRAGVDAALPQLSGDDDE